MSRDCRNPVSTDLAEGEACCEFFNVEKYEDFGGVEEVMFTKFVVQ